MLAPLRRARALPLLGALGLAMSVGIPAHADTADARARAKAILAKVQKLQAEVKQAEQAYDQSLGGVAASVNAAIQTGRASDEIAAQAATAQDQLDNRVRGLYMSGGPLAIYATLLESGDITDFQTRMVLANSVVSSDRTLAQADQAVAAQAAAQAVRAGSRNKRQIQTEHYKQGATTRIIALLNQQQTLLSQAQATLRLLQH